MEGELSISCGKEADHIGHNVINCFELIESQNNLNCKGIICLVQSSFEYS